MELHDPLIRILRAGFRSFRARRVLESAALSASVIVPALLVALLLGMLLGPGRLAAWLSPLVAVGGALAGLMRGVRYGLRSHIGFGAFVLAIEEKAGLARNELVNALQLGRRVASMEDPLAREVAQEVLRRGTDAAERIHYRDLAPGRSLRGPIGQTVGALLTIAILALVAPGAVVRSAFQITHPGRLPESAALRIDVDPGDCVAQRGASLPIRARLVGVLGEPVLFHRAGGGAWQRETMHPDSGAFHATLSDLQAPTEYAVALGDLRSRSYRVDLQEPLRATGYEKRTTFPAYTGMAPEKELSPHGSISVLRGSEVELRVGVSRADASGRLAFDSGRSLALADAGSSVLSTRLPIRDAEQFHVELSSPAIRGAAWRSESFRIDPIPDRSPSLYLLAPGEQVDLPPDMQIGLAVDCADDFGITRLELTWKRNDGPATRVPLARWSKEREARVEYPWDLEQISMAPGDRITYRLELTDNDVVSGPKTTVSPEYVIRFPTVEQMYAQQTEERQSGIEDVKESFEKQVELREQLEKMTRDLRQESGMQWEQKQEVESFLQKQEEILQKMDSMTSAMDRQMQRMQQGQLFSPEIVSKLSQIQDLMRQIQSPEFRKMMEKMREAMRSLDPEAVKKALEEMKLSQKELERGLDRTLQMLQKLLAEEKLDEMIKQAERLAEQQDELNRQLGQNGQKPDSTSALTPQQAEQMQKQQEELRKSLEELRKQMKDLQDLAKQSHPQMNQELQSPQAEQSRNELQQSSENMESGKQCMGRQNRSGAMKSGKKASSNLRNFSQQMRQMQSQMQQQMTAEQSKRLLGLAGDLVDLSKQQEDLVARSNRESTRDLALEQNRIEKASGTVVDQIYELARETPFITPAQARALGDVLGSLTNATDAFETGLRTNGSAMGRRAQTGMDQVVESLIESNQNMCNSASSSSSCNKPNPNSMMQGLSSQQMGVNQQTQELSAQSSLQGGRLSQDQAGRLEQLAAQQQAIRQGLQDLSESMGDSRNTMGRLDDLAKEMEETVRQMREKNVDERLLKRQERILSRLLTAQRSLRKQDFEEQRRSRTGVDAENPVSPATVATGMSESEQLRRGILKGNQDPVPGDFRRIIDAYFRALMEKR
jgi:hypothetical protein